MTIYEANAPGKVILIGEHAVVHGARAVAMPLSTMRMHVKLTRTDRKSSQGTPVIQVLPEGQNGGSHLVGVVKEAFDTLSVAPFSLDIEVRSSIPIGAGLGSSASICIAVLRAIAAAVGLKIDENDLSLAGNRLERRFHGNPSGLDACVIACETLISFKKGEPPQAIHVTPMKASDARSYPWRFVLLDSRGRSSTLAMIQVAAFYFNGLKGEKHLQRFDTIAKNVIHGLEAGCVELVSEAMNEAGARLAEAGVVTPRLMDIIDEVRLFGVLAAKPTGSGGGGCVLALLDPSRYQTQFDFLIKKFGPKNVIPVELS